MPVEMTENDKKKEFLRRYRECERREQEILEEIQRLRMDKMFPSSVNDGMPKGRTREQIDLAIRRMENPDEQRVLRLRYLWGLKWEEVAVKMSYSWKQIHRLHSSALDNFEMT